MDKNELLSIFEELYGCWQMRSHSMKISLIQYLTLPGWNYARLTVSL